MGLPEERWLAGMAHCLEPTMLLLLLLWLFLRSPSSDARNRCVVAAEACTADAQCQQLRTEYVAQCLSRTASGGCPRARCGRALRRFFAHGSPALTHALLFCPCFDPVCAERRRQTFVPACAFSGPGPVQPSCLVPLDACEHSRVCRPRLLAFQASCAPVPTVPDGCPLGQASRCRHAYAGLIGTVVTPNYVDNTSARVAPWCNCGASGNRREECEAFRELFTRNHCLDGAIQAFDSRQLPVMQDHQDSRQDLEHNLLELSPLELKKAQRTCRLRSKLPGALPQLSCLLCLPATWPLTKPMSRVLGFVCSCLPPQGTNLSISEKSCKK
ncbi:GDNF family receptor alpha-4 [Sturnira hondurensis]|uniref:GDNF family receptor alpha-4 n=1 Tax=Sturnira hondurensis TaxID=192404 RepID=UPI00187A3F2C|nr:GDNF family receptor alpha-4 [Sturnira hondurensis]